MWGWPCWTPRAKRCPIIARPCAAAGPTPPTRRRSCSRWHCSSCLKCHWCWRCSAAEAACCPGRGWAGSPWALTAPARSSRPTGLRWRRQRVSRCATGTPLPTRRGKVSEDCSGIQSGCGLSTAMLHDDTLIRGLWGCELQLRLSYHRQWALHAWQLFTGL